LPISSPVTQTAEVEVNNAVSSDAEPTPTVAAGSISRPVPMEMTIRKPRGSRRAGWRMPWRKAHSGDSGGGGDGAHCATHERRHGGSPRRAGNPGESPHPELHGNQ